MRLLPYPTGRALFLLLVEMILAVLQLRNAQRDRLGAFARELLHVLQFLPQLLRILHLREDFFGETVFHSRNSFNRTRHNVRLKIGSTASVLPESSIQRALAMQRNLLHITSLSRSGEQ